MKLDDFLVDYFPQNEKVTVSAVELQQLVNAKREAENTVKSHEKSIQHLQHKVMLLEAKIEFMESACLHVDLRG